MVFSYALGGILAKFPKISIMSLRDQLRDILPKILPNDPNDSIKGTELIRLVKYELRQDYSDATLRYHFSIMSCDPSAPIAKVAQGQGYYLRPDSRGNPGGARHLIAFRQPTLGEHLRKSPSEINRDLLHAEKFRAIVQRYYESNQRFPFFFEHAFAPGSPSENIWRYPDAAVVDWPAGEATEDGFRLDPLLLKRRRTLNAPLYLLTSLKLRLNITHESYREEFFQCLSQSEWAHSCEFLIANPIADASLADALAELGQRHGIGILSTGFTSEVLDDLPEAAAILEMTPAEFDAVLARAKFSRLSAPETRKSLDWPTLAASERDSADLQALFGWIENGLESGCPRPFHES